MNFINRMLIIAQLLIGIALMPIILVLFLFFLPALADILTNLARGMTASASLTQAIGAGAAGFIFVVAILLLFLELHYPTRSLRVQVGDTQVQVTEEAITQRLERAVGQIAQVVRVKPTVAANRRNLVNVTLELETTPDVIVPKKTQEVISAAKQVLEEQMGLQVGAIRVRLQHAKSQAAQKS